MPCVKILGEKNLTPLTWPCAGIFCLTPRYPCYSRCRSVWTVHGLPLFWPLASGCIGPTGYSKGQGGAGRRVVFCLCPPLRSELLRVRQLSPYGYPAGGLVTALCLCPFTEGYSSPLVLVQEYCGLLLCFSAHPLVTHWSVPSGSCRVWLIPPNLSAGIYHRGNNVRTLVSCSEILTSPQDYSANSSIISLARPACFLNIPATCYFSVTFKLEIQLNFFPQMPVSNVYLFTEQAIASPQIHTITFKYRFLQHWSPYWAVFCQYQTSLTTVAL